MKVRVIRIKPRFGISPLYKVQFKCLGFWVSLSEHFEMRDAVQDANSRLNLAPKKPKVDVVWELHNDT